MNWEDSYKEFSSEILQYMRTQAASPSMMMRILQRLGIPLPSEMNKAHELIADWIRLQGEEAFCSKMGMNREDASATKDESKDPGSSPGSSSVKPLTWKSRQTGPRPIAANSPFPAPPTPASSIPASPKPVPPNSVSPNPVAANPAATAPSPPKPHISKVDRIDSVHFVPEIELGTSLDDSDDETEGSASPIKGVKGRVAGSKESFQQRSALEVLREFPRSVITPEARAAAERGESPFGPPPLIDRRSGYDRRSGSDRRAAVELVFRNNRYGANRRHTLERRADPPPKRPHNKPVDECLGNPELRQKGWYPNKNKKS